MLSLRGGLKVEVLCKEVLASDESEYRNDMAFWRSSGVCPISIRGRSWSCSILQHCDAFLRMDQAVFTQAVNGEGGVAVWGWSGILDPLPRLCWITFYCWYIERFGLQ